MSREIEFKNISAENIKAFERKADGEFAGRLIVKGYAAVFGNVDSYGDVIVKGAFAKTITGENKEDIAFCWQHDMKQPIGNIMVLKEDDFGLYFEAVISASEEGRAVKIEEGIIKKFSIGYWVEERDFKEEDGESLRFLKELGLAEFSAVTRAANKKAKIISTERKAEDFDLQSMGDEELKALELRLEVELKSREPEAKTVFDYINLK